MYYFQKNKWCRLISLLMAVILLYRAQVFAEDEISPYPVLEGSANAQEIFERTIPQDISDNIAVQFVLAGQMMSLDENGNFNADEQLTQAQGLALAINASGKKSEVKMNAKDWKSGYIKLAKSSGMLSREEETAAKAQDYNEKIDHQTLARWMTRALGSDFYYHKLPTEKVSRLQAAELIYQNKERVLPHLQASPTTGQEPSANKLLYKGEVQHIQRVMDKGVQSMLIRIKSDEGGFFDVLANREKNFPVSLSGQMHRNPSVLESGRRAEFYLKDGRVYFAIVQPALLDTVEGRLEGIKGNNIVLKDGDGKTMIYTYSPNATFYTEQEGSHGFKSKSISKEDLIHGQEIRMELKDHIAEKIYAYLSIDPDLDGYIPPQSRMVAGRVLEAGEDYLVLEDGHRYEITTETMIQREGILSDLSFLKEGDQVKLYMDDIYGTKITRLAIEGSQRQVDAVMKGKIASYGQGNGKLSLNQLKMLSGGVWQDVPSQYSNMQVAGEVYVGGAKIDPAKINRYKDQTIYMAVSKNQRNNKVQKANILVGTPMSFAEKIEKVDLAASYLSIDGVISNYSKGTLVIKDGRLVDERNIQEKLSAYVETAMNGNNASLIVMDGPPVPNHTPHLGYVIYRATLETLFTYKLSLSNDLENEDREGRFYYVNEGNEWTMKRAGRDEPKLRFSDDTYFYDADNGKEVDVDIIKELRFSERSRKESSAYLGRQVYVVARNGVALAVSFEKDTLTNHLVHAENMMKGKVEQVDIEKKTVQLQDVSKYNQLRKIYMPQKAERDDKGEWKLEEVDLSKALVIKDGRPLSYKAYAQLMDKRVRIIYKQKNTKSSQGIVLIVE